jgi:[NiFe] hydrogenase assembly HybE family chaperone
MADDSHGRDDEARAAGEKLAAFYRGAERAMRDLPMHNPALSVAAVGFHAIGDHAFGVIVAPWFMSLIRVPLDAEHAQPPQGAMVSRGLPAGALDFTAARIDGIGTIETCSLFSPMFDFADQATAEAAAAAALAAVLDRNFEANARADATPRGPVAVDRRRLLRGQFSERQP